MNFLTGPIRTPGRHRRQGHPDRLMAWFEEWNDANNPLTPLREGIAAGETPLVPFIAGLLGNEMPEYGRLMGQAFRAGYSIQRHPAEQHGYAAIAPMLVRKT